MKITNDNETCMMSDQDKLFQAIKLNNFWMVHVLIKSADDLKATNSDGLNPIEYPYKLGRQKMAEFLKSKAAELI